MIKFSLITYHWDEFEFINLFSRY